MQNKLKKSEKFFVNIEHHVANQISIIKNLVECRNRPKIQMAIKNKILIT